MVSKSNNNHPTCVVKPVYGYPTFPLTAKAASSVLLGFYFLGYTASSVLLGFKTSIFAPTTCTLNVWMWGKKEEIRLSPMTKTQISTEMSKVQHDNTKTSQKIKLAKYDITTYIMTLPFHSLDICHNHWVLVTLSNSIQFLNMLFKQYWVSHLPHHHDKTWHNLHCTYYRGKTVGHGPWIYHQTIRWTETGNGLAIIYATAIGIHL